jgi:pyridinium-3,5-bisthiocarboxylic acid mononucleotide nickel chelatase
VGYGFGTMTLPWPNALRVYLSEERDVPKSAPSGEVLLETNIDDMNPQGFELLTERLYAGGALEVWLTPVQMKKSRPATVLSLLAPAQIEADLTRIVLENSTSLGVRSIRVERTKVDRAFESAITRFGDVSLKLKILDGRVLSVMPEYDDCARLARSSGAPLSEVWNEAHRIGERFIGVRMVSGSRQIAAE